MKSLRQSALLALLAASAANAQLPPLIDRNLFFGDPEIIAAQLSPDGKFLAFIKPLDKTRNVWVKRIGEPFAAAKPVTALTKRPIAGYFWSRDGKYVLFVQDDGGDENFNVWAVDPAASPTPGEKAPPAKNLTKAEKIQAQIVHVSKVDPDLLFVGMNDRDKAWHDLYRVKISTGERSLVRQNTGRFTGWEFDDKDNIRLAQRTADNGDTEVLRVDGDGKFEKIAGCTVLESCGVLRFHKDQKRVYYLTNAGAADLIALYLLDPATGKMEFVDSDPLKKVDLGAVSFSEAGDIESITYLDSRRRRYFRDKRLEAEVKALEAKFPGREVSRSSRTLDEQVWLVNVGSDIEPGEVYLYDRRTKKTELQYKVIEKLDRAALSPMKAIEYPSSDGLVIPAYLTLPKGLPAKNLPLVVLPHGGPWARDLWGFNPIHQFLANRGYAVLSPNFRGSTGFGKKFLNAGNGQWGAKMQDDITWGVKHLVKDGAVDAKRVGIMGGSYGGYATLAGVAFTPDVYSAAVSIVGPSNLQTLLDSLPAYWEAGRKMFYTRMGDPSTEEGKAALKRMSPLFAADKIKTPLMVVQGANDPRVNQAESDQIVIALRDRNYPVKYLVAADEGHGFAKPINNLAMFVAVERFLEQHLKGRSQKDVPEEVAKKLDELTVDPAKVKLTPKVDASKAAGAKPARGLTPGSYAFTATIELGQQKINLGITTEIQKSDAGYTITEKMQSPMGEAVDVSILDGATLEQKSRQVKQGPVTIEWASDGKKVSGKMSMNGQDRPLNADLTGPLFADSAGQFIIGALPLAAGYEAVYRNFDLQKAKEKLLSLKVLGAESVTVPAGTFDTWKVEIKGDDGAATTYWIDKISSKPVKAKSSMPQMNGATMTLELK